MYETWSILAAIESQSLILFLEAHTTAQNIFEQVNQHVMKPEVLVSYSSATLSSSFHARQWREGVPVAGLHRRGDLDSRVSRGPGGPEGSRVPGPGGPDLHLCPSPDQIRQAAGEKSRRGGKLPQSYLRYQHSVFFF